MNIPSKEFVISELQDYLKISLSKLPKYRVFYSGLLNDIEDISICTPESKLHKNGHGWIDITSKQILLLKKAKYSILAFRLEGNKVYYVNFSDLEKYLTQEYIFNNSREGNHWKLYIWPKHIEIRGNAKHLLVEPNKLSNFNI
ncbi:MAG: hypothetical protein ACOYLP_09110 [Flavobacterium sp.]|uniref:hypothetical protein n=1 Tax=Flavobacterium sp. TaxID=239 RepID=UPI003BBA53E3